MNNFAVLDMALSPWDTGTFISLPTNVPCHLTCYWTAQKPLKHPTERTIRGLTVPWGVYFCFVTWHAVEQIETGDTYYHTFDLSPWPICETRWYTFRGTVTDVLSPSVGPIFEKHLQTILTRDVILRPNAPGDECNPRITGFGLPCPDHWDTVKTPPPDMDDRYLIGATINHWWGYDLYHIPTASLPLIEKVTLTHRFKAIGGYAYVRVNSHRLKTHGYTYNYSLRDVFSDWRYYSLDFVTNPVTGEPWTQAEINDLQIGVGLRYTWGVGWARQGYCSEVYVTVRRKLPYT